MKGSSSKDRFSGHYTDNATLTERVKRALRVREIQPRHVRTASDTLDVTISLRVSEAGALIRVLEGEE